MNALDAQRRDTKLNHARCSEQQSVLLILISNKLFMMLSQLSVIDFCLDHLS